MIALRRRRHWLKRGFDEVAGFFMAGLVKAFFALLRLLGADRASALGGLLTRKIGALLPVNRVGLDNLRAAYPDKSDAELRTILAGVWDNLGRTVAEYPFLQELFDYDYFDPAKATRSEVVGIEQFIALLETKKPTIVFSAHLANWEMVAVAAARYGLDTTVVFRPPNNVAASRAIEAFRSQAMGNLLPSGPGAAARMVSVLEKGGRLGMLADQHLTLGLIVPFFGRPALTNPILAKLARRFDCPVHGSRCIRLPDGRFRLELTPPIDLPRDAAGLIDVDKATAVITNVVEGWVREYPEQWLWLHRRWRVKTPAAAPNETVSQHQIAVSDERNK